MMAYRIIRATDRRIFKIDVGGIAPQDVEQYMQKVMTQMKRHQVVDPTSGRVDLRYNPLSLEEDYFIPMRGGVGSDIISLQGAKNLDDIEDVKYMRDKLFSAIKIPQAYLTNLEGDTEDKTTLAQKDIRFARTIQRLQRALLSEMEKIAVVHLYTLGFRGEDLLGFSLSLNNPSRLAELQQLEYMRTKFDVANAIPEGVYSKQWVSKNILGMSDDEFLRNQRETFYDRKYQQSLEAVIEQGAEEALGGELGDLGGDEGLGDLGGDEGLGDLGGEEAPELGGDEASALLTAPARREDHVYEKSSYTPVPSDSRRKGALGPRIRQARATANPEAIRGRSSRTKRPQGYIADIRFGLEEQKSSIYNDSERKLMENTAQVRQIIKQLEEKEVEKDET